MDRTTTEHGGDQRARGSLGVAESLGEVRQALLGGGQRGLDGVGTQVWVLPGVLGGFLDAGAGELAVSTRLGLGVTA